jgi:hypothetical protein
LRFINTHTYTQQRTSSWSYDIYTYILGYIRTYIRTYVWCTCISRVGRRGDGVAAATAAMRLKQQIRISPAAHLTTRVLMRRTRHYNSNNNNDNNDSTYGRRLRVYTYCSMRVTAWATTTTIVAPRDRARATGRALVITVCLCSLPPPGSKS